MRLSPWQIVGPLAVAAVLLAAMFLHQAAPASCDEADESFEKYLDVQAGDLYAEILDDEPDSSCASSGMQYVAWERCWRARELAAKGATDEARKIYVSVLGMEPLGTAFTCVKEGFALLGGGEDGNEAKCSCLMACPAKCTATGCPEQQDPEIDDPEPPDKEKDDPEPRDGEHDDPEPDDPEPQDPERDDPEPKDPERDDPEPQDPERDDPEPQDPERDDPEPHDGPRKVHPKPCSWSG